MKALQRQGIDESYVRTLEDIYIESTTVLKLSKNSEKIQTEKRVLGRPISPKLFTCVQEILKNFDWENVGININREYLKYLRFLDDIVIRSESSEELKKIIKDLKIESRNVGLKMNSSNTKIIFNENVETTNKPYGRVSREYIYFCKECIIPITIVQNQIPLVGVKEHDFSEDGSRINLVLLHSQLNGSIKVQIALNTCT
ncbi:uncharacterized protein [Palaemon carinicauda]|uniref:uncharacterized protein n=1 Tax=Palaemon carinicauda TaxID=392227 RepID=UPI0035B5BC45